MLPSEVCHGRLFNTLLYDGLFHVLIVTGSFFFSGLTTCSLNNFDADMDRTQQYLQ